MHTKLVTRECWIGKIALSFTLLWCVQLHAAAEIVGGSVALTSDYLVRGISRTNQGAALQADLHVASDSGWFAGLFASNVQFDSGDRRSVELNPFAGYARQAGEDWRVKMIAGYYGYAFNASGSQYNYSEVSAEAAYAGWLDLDVIFSPAAPRYVSYRGLTGVSASTVEANLHTPWRHHVAAVIGVGSSRLGGLGGGTYGYWSAGGVVDLAPLSISLHYVSTSSEAAALYSRAAAHNRWTATLLWRF
jgi:uncharacterized protein (TIGR02001 family)